MKREFVKLAQLIKLAAIDVSKANSWWKVEHVHEMLGFKRTDQEPEVLDVEDDSGYRAIIIGDTRGNVSLDTGKLDNTIRHRGYAYLYSENVAYHGEEESWEFGYECFPPVKVIAGQLEQLYDGRECDSVKYYCGDDEDMYETLAYLSSVVKKYVDRIKSDPRTPSQIFY